MTLILRMFADFFIFIRLDQPNPQNPRSIRDNNTG